MNQKHSYVFGEKATFAIEVTLSQKPPVVAIWSQKISSDEGGFFSTSFNAESFLSRMTSAWGRIFLEQTYPIYSEKTVFSAQHFVFIHKDNEENLSCVEAFEHAHNIGYWLGQLIPLYCMRQGNYFEVTWDRTSFSVPFTVMMDILTGLGNFLSEYVSDEHRRLWLDIENISICELLTFSSGISDENDILRNFISENVSITFQNLIEDHQYLAISRMAYGGDLDSDDALAAIKSLQTIPRTCISERVQEPRPLWANDIPYNATSSHLKPHEQAYTLAEHVREHSGEQCSVTGKVCLYPMLSKLGFEVLEKDLPSKIHALSVWRTPIEQFIVLNTAKKALGVSKNYLHRSAMAHELCHILLDKDRARPLVDVSLPKTDDPVEKRARAFAAEFLLPRSHAIRFINEKEDRAETVDLLAIKYEVSLAIAACQLKFASDQFRIPLTTNIQRYVDEVLAYTYSDEEADARRNNFLNEIMELKNLQAGWYEGYGEAPSSKDIHWLHKKIEKLSNFSIMPGIFPTPEGGVQLEWDLGSHQGIIEFDIKEKKCNWLNFSIDNPDQILEQVIDLSVDSGWNILDECVNKFMDIAAND